MKEILMFTLNGAVNQHFSLPGVIISYICKKSKPSNKVMFKLYYSCKFFWQAIKVLPVYELEISDTHFHVKDEKRKEILFLREKLYSLNYKFYIHAEFIIITKFRKEMKLLSSLMSIWRFELKGCFLIDQTLTLEEYKMLALNLEEMIFDKTKILQPDMSLVPINVLFKLVPKIYRFILEFSIPCIEHCEAIYSKEALKKLFVISNNTKLNDFTLFGLSEAVDPTLLSNFIKNNSSSDSYYRLVFWLNFTDEWKQQFYKMVERNLKQWEGYSCAFENMSWNFVVEVKKIGDKTDL